jgi:predicted aspartyl protease
MAFVYTEVTLKNATDVGMFERGIMKGHEVRQMTARALVDTAAWTLVINEATRARLGLKIQETDEIELANGITEEGGITEPVSIYWKDRSTVCRAAVLPNGDDVLLGAFPLEGLDLTINPKREEVVGAHGDKVRRVVM